METTQTKKIFFAVVTCAFQLFTIGESDATPLKIEVNAENQHRFARIASLDALRVIGGCYARDARKFWIGTFYNGSFKVWRSAEIRRFKKQGKKRALKKAFAECKKLIQLNVIHAERKVRYPFQPAAPTLSPTKIPTTEAASPTRVPTRTSTRISPPLTPTPLTPTPRATWTTKVRPTVTSRPTSTATPRPTPRPTVTPTVRPSATATPRPAATATSKPTIAPTVKPSSTATQRPTATMTPRPTATSQVGRSLVSIPYLREWETRMYTFGKKHCDSLKNGVGSFDNLLAATYYDAQWVYYQIADYTGQASWNECARAARTIYRDRYVAPANGAVPGYWNFTHGLSQDFLRFGTAESRRNALLLSTNAAYANDQTPLDWTKDAGLSREVAYTILAYLHTQDMGEAPRPRLKGLVDQALGHLNQWFVAKPQINVRSFMVGLTMQALIEYNARYNDTRVLPALTQALDVLWELNWVETAAAMRYQTWPDLGEGNEPSHDLNLLIAPAYAWVFKQTGLTRFRDRGDKIFTGGVKSAFVENPKQFNQSYRWSFDYVKWRKG